MSSREFIKYNWNYKKFGLRVRREIGKNAKISDQKLILSKFSGKTKIFLQNFYTVVFSISSYLK